MTQALMSDLARAKAAFQRRTLISILTEEPHMTTKSTTSGHITAERHGDTITLTKRDNGPSTSYSAADIINLAHSIAVEGVLDLKGGA